MPVYLGIHTWTGALGEEVREVVDFVHKRTWKNPSERMLEKITHLTYKSKFETHVVFNPLLTSVYIKTKKVT